MNLICVEDNIDSSKCTFRTNIEQSQIDDMLAGLISAMTKEGKFKEAIQNKIGTTVDTSDMEKELAVLKTKLHQAETTKVRLEEQMDTLDVTVSHYEKKVADLQRRLDSQYDTIDEVEQAIAEVKGRILESSISADSIYNFLLHFNEIYRECSDAEKKKFMQSFVECIELFPERREDGSRIKNIRFNFSIPVIRDDEELSKIDGISLENGTLSCVDMPLEKLSTNETVALLAKLSEAKHHIEVKVDMDELDLTAAESKATYEEIQDWVQEKYGFHVSHLNIAQVKRKYGIIERENYNKPKSPDSRQPGCTEEKVKAIEAALKHFQMI